MAHLYSSAFTAACRRLQARIGDPSTQRLRVLVVDDEESIRTFVTRVLDESGCTVVTAADGIQALAAAATSERFDLLLTDLIMPGMNGDELARRLRAIEPDLPVLYLTGFSDRLFTDRMILWANEAFLDKPCSIRALREAVSLLISGRLDLINLTAVAPVTGSSLS